MKITKLIITAILALSTTLLVCAAPIPISSTDCITLLSSQDALLSVPQVPRATIKQLNLPALDAPVVPDAGAKAAVSESIIKRREKFQSQVCINGWSDSTGEKKVDDGQSKVTESSDLVKRMRPPNLKLLYIPARKPKASHYAPRPYDDELTNVPRTPTMDEVLSWSRRLPRGGVLYDRNKLSEVDASIPKGSLMVRSKNHKGTHPRILSEEEAALADPSQYLRAGELKQLRNKIRDARRVDNSKLKKALIDFSQSMQNSPSAPLTSPASVSSSPLISPTAVPPRLLPHLNSISPHDSSPRSSVTMHTPYQHTSQDVAATSARNTGSAGSSTSPQVSPPRTSISDELWAAFDRFVASHRPASPVAQHGLQYSSPRSPSSTPTSAHRPPTLSASDQKMIEIARQHFLEDSP